jgi:hypothetical protein
MNIKTPNELKREIGLPETVTLARKDKPDVRWTGRLLAEVDSDTESRDGGGSKRRWTRLQLWELESGAWLAASIGCSDRDGEVDIGDVALIRSHHPTRGAPPVAPERGADERRKEVMEFFGWSWLAKKLAKQMGWEVVEVIKE